MKGIPGTASKIALSFLSPGGTQTGMVLPCGGSKTTTLNIKDKQGRGIRASLVDIANPGVFVNGAELGLNAEITPAELDRQADMMALLEDVRREGAEKMTLDPNVASVPKVVVLFPPSAEEIAAGVNIRCIALSMGKAHKGIPLTIALNLGAACRMEGTIASDLARQLKDGGDVLIRHPGGTIDVGADIVKEEVHSALLYSTARLLMRGEVNTD
jgi:2-methylaconitate cis-trans-isomerase PrpF